jgi:creatinine amidohydrolase/Fe(II)-dependent formamide hydrolase-like protein
VDAAAAELRGRDGITCGIFDRRSLDDDQIKVLFGEGEGTGVRHGGRVETSMVMASKPSHVDPERMSALPPVWVNLLPRLRAGARDFAEAGGTDAYFGEPAAASREEGERMLEYLARQVVCVATQPL